MSRPTLLNSCAFAATAREAAFRIDASRGPARVARVVPLDPGAEAAVQRLGTAVTARTVTTYPDAAPEVVNGADLVLMVATSSVAADLAAEIGTACRTSGTMTVGVVLGISDTDTDTDTDGAAVQALRPHSRMLLVSTDPDDVAAILEAVGG